MVELHGGTLLFQFLNFFVLVAILAKFGYKPLLAVMEERKKKIEDDLRQAEEAKGAAAALQEEYTQKLLDARKEAMGIIEKATVQAETSADEILKDTQRLIERQKEQAKAQIAQEREQALAAAKGEVVGLSVTMAEKILGKEINATIDDQLLQDAIQAMDSKKVGLS